MQVDANEAYKRGKDFYAQHLYGKAQEEFAHVLAARPTAQEVQVPAFVREAQLYYGMSSLRLNRPDAEKELLAFINDYSPSNVANKAIFEVAGYYYDTEDYRKAIEYYDRVNDLNMDNASIAEARFKQGYSYFITKDFKKARSVFKDIKDIQDEYYYPSNYYYGISNFFLEDNKEALISFQRVNKSKSYSRVVPYYICQIYFAQNKYDEVIEYGEPLVADKALRNRLEISQLIGQSYFEKGNYEKALPFMEEYVTGAGKVSKENLYQLGMTQMETGNCAAAVGNFEQLSGLNEEIGQSALYNLGGCQVKLGDKRAARNAFAGASKLSFNKKTQEEATFLYAKLSAELGFDSDAVDALQKIPMSSPRYNESQELLGEVFVNTRDYDNALTILRKITNKTPKLKESYQKVAYYRGVQLYNDGEKEQANKLFDESLETPSDDDVVALCHYWKGEYLYDAKQYDNSIREYTKFQNGITKNSDLPDNSSTHTANYAIGYNYWDKKDYSNAATYFEKCVTGLQKSLTTIKDLYVLKQVYPDAMLRAGDCHLANRSYEKAKTYYNLIINNGFKNNDYAMFQKANILGIQDEPAKKITVLTDLISSYPNSTLADDAYFSIGSTYNELGKGDLATTNFQKITTNYKESELCNKAYLAMGLIAFNAGQNDKSLEYYKQVIAHNPDGTEQKTALEGIREVYDEMGNSDGYLTYLSTIGVAVSDLEKEQIAFSAAEKPYNEEDNEKAILTLTSYISKYPRGANILKAHFDRAESFLALKRYKDAHDDYAFILSQPKNTQSEVAAYKASDIAFKYMKDNAKAYAYYLQLDNLATSDKAKYFAAVGLMRTGWATGKKTQQREYCDRVLKSSLAQSDDKGLAYYYIGKVALDEKKYDEARLAFKQCYDLLPSEEEGAESVFQVANIAYIKRNLKDAETLANEAAENIAGSDYWLVKSYLLLADVYSEQGKVFNAKATLKGIIENFESEKDLVAEAKTKLKALETTEAGKSKIDSGNGAGNGGLLEMDKN